MSNPTLNKLTTGAAQALEGTVDAATGITHLSSTVSGIDLVRDFINSFYWLFALLGRTNQGAVVSISGLNVGVYKMTYSIAGTKYAYAGDATYALTDDATNYLYLDTAATLKKSTTAWPAGAHVKLAEIVTASGAIVTLTDARAMNWRVGVDNEWYGVTAAGDVDLGNFGIDNLKKLDLTSWSELTIASGLITPTQMLHTVDTEADAASDDLTDLTAVAGERRIVILTAENVARVVTVKSTGNIALLNGDYALDSADKMILLLQDSDTTWTELLRNYGAPSTLDQTLDADGNAITNIGKMTHQPGTQALASGAIAYTQTLTGLQPETGTSDDLDTISGGTTGARIRLRNANASLGHTVTVKHETDNISLATGEDFAMTSVADFVELEYSSGGVWREVSRSTYKLTDLISTGKAIPHPIVAHKDGALTGTPYLLDHICEHAMTVSRASGYVRTAPSGGSCVVDVQKNGSSIFVADANRISIADGTNSDSSDVIGANFSVGDRLTVQVLQDNGAQDLSVSVRAFVAAEGVTVV